MTETEIKAREIIVKIQFQEKQLMFEDAKNIALILIDENIKMLKQILDSSAEIYQALNTPKKLCIDLLNPLLKYWNQVKNDVKNL